MLLRSSFISRIFSFALFLALLFVFGLSNARAQFDDVEGDGGAAAPAVDDFDDDDWKLDRKEILKEVEREVQAQLEVLVTKEKIVKEQLVKWKLEPPWEWPLQKSIKTLAQVEAGLLEVLEKEAAKKFPLKKHHERVAQEMAEKFKMYKVADNVSFQVRGGRGTNTLVEGTVQVISAERVRIGLRWIFRDDIPEEQQALFYQEVNDKLRQEYEEREQRIYDARVDNFKFEQRQERLPGEMLKAFYVPDRRKKNASLRNPNPDSWISREEAVNLLYVAMRKVVGDQLRAKISAEKFKEAEYEYVKEKKEWMPIDVAERWRAQQAAKVEAEHPHEDGMMDGPPPM